MQGLLPVADGTRAASFSYSPTIALAFAASRRDHGFGRGEGPLSSTVSIVRLRCPRAHVLCASRVVREHIVSESCALYDKLCLGLLFMVCKALCIYSLGSCSISCLSGRNERSVFDVYFNAVFGVNSESLFVLFTRLFV